MHRIDRRVLHTTLLTGLLIAGMYWVAPQQQIPTQNTPLLADKQTQPIDQAAAPSS